MVSQAKSTPRLNEPASRRPVVFALLLCLARIGGGSSTLDALDPSKAFHQYQLDVWQTEQGCPQSSIVEILRTKDGYLWLGGYEDLVRFDGTRFEVVATSREIGNNVQALAEGLDGDLWVGTDGGGLTRLRGRDLKTYTSRDGLADDHVRSLLASRDGSLWIGTYGGLSHFKDGEFTNTTAFDGLPHELVRTLHEDRHGALWVGTHGGIVRFEDGKWTTLGESDGLPDPRVSALTEDRDGNLWIGTHGGTLSRFAGGTFDVFTRDGLDDRDVQVLHEDRDGNLWIGTHGHGVYRLDPSRTTLTSHSLEDGLTSDVVWDLQEDDEGSLWIGTEGGGLNRLRDTRFTPFTTADGLPHNRVWVVAQDSAGNLWFGTDGGGLTRYAPDGSITYYTVGDGLLSGNVTAIHPGQDGSLWIGTDRGLNRLRDGRITAPWRDRVGSPVVLALAEDREGNLWVGTEVAGVQRLTDGGATTYSTANGLPDDTSRALFLDRDGVFWIGTDGGLVRFSDTGMTTYTDLPLVRSISQDQDGTVWIGTRGHGLGRIVGDDLVVFTTADGLYSDVVYHVLEDDRQNLWMSCNKGIFRVATGELARRARGEIPAVRSTVYGTADGMKSDECTGGSQPAAARDRQGRLWFPTAQGLTIVDPENLKENEVPPPVYVEEVLADNEPLEWTGETVVLASGVKDLELHFTALSLLDPKRVHFKVQLVGYDDDWVDVSDRRFVRYTNLDPGPYLFRVIASNNDGVWNAVGASVELYRQPAFYQTWTFYALCAVLTTTLGFLVHRFLVRQLLNHNRDLRAMKERLEAKNAEVEAKNAEVKAKNAEIKAKNAEMKSFTHAVSHDLKSPLVTIQGFLSMLEGDVKAGDAERTKKDVDMIRKAATKMQHLLDELLALARVGRVITSPQEVPLGEVVQEALVILAGPIAEHQVEVTVAAELPIVFGDRPRLLGVFQNLIENAVKYRHAEKPPRIEIGIRPDENGSVVYVRDNGMGIDPLHHDRIFEVFEQLNARRDGAGVGLAMVKRIIDVHHGRIWVESEGVGKGSTFAFVLPDRKV